MIQKKKNLYDSFTTRCAIPGLDNDTYAIQSDYHQLLVNLTIPAAAPNDDDDIYDKCNIFDIDLSKINDVSIIANRSITKACDRWVYDDSVFTSTLAAEVYV